MKTSLFQDTIAAIATPPGIGGIAVLRISGPDAYKETLKFLNKINLRPRVATFSSFLSKNKRRVIDHVIATYFSSPNSYTGEDVVEISCHGGEFISRYILEELVGGNIRLAGPGEFTRRAFVNGKMDLLQAEAVADMIHATSDRAQKNALLLLDGRLSLQIEEIRSQLLELTTIIELELDFSEHEIIETPRAILEKKLSSSWERLDTLTLGINNGRLIREGVKVAIIGKPNAGKSSLLNAMLQEDRAIISDTPGTTRDTIEEYYHFGGVLYRLIDTAGLGDSHDSVEQLGQERTKRQISLADIVLIIIDVRRGPDYTFEENIIQTIRHKPVIVVFNKSDLMSSTPQHPFDENNSLYVSAKYGTNINGLMEKVHSTVAQRYHIQDESVYISHSRHQNALALAMENITKAIAGMAHGLTYDFISYDIREAIDALGLITGDIRSEDILNEIFSHFCIGK